MQANGKMFYGSARGSGLHSGRLGKPGKKAKSFQWYQTNKKLGLSFILEVQQGDGQYRVQPRNI